MTGFTKRIRVSEGNYLRKVLRHIARGEVSGCLVLPNNCISLRFTDESSAIANPGPDVKMKDEAEALRVAERVCLNRLAALQEWDRQRNSIS